MNTDKNGMPSELGHRFTNLIYFFPNPFKHLPLPPPHSYQIDCYRRVVNLLMSTLKQKDASRGENLQPFAAILDAIQTIDSKSYTAAPGSFAHIHTEPPLPP